MGKFKEFYYLEEGFGTDAAQFAQQFRQLMQFLRKYDYLGIEKQLKICTSGYFSIIYDFLKSVMQCVTKRQCHLTEPLRNLAKIIPAAVLFGTAAYASPAIIPVAGAAGAGAIATAIKVIQYAYWPFWIWASKNINNPDDKVAQKAQLLMKSLPEQIKAILAATPPTLNQPQKEWVDHLASQPIFG